MALFTTCVQHIYKFYVDIGWSRFHKKVNTWSKTTQNGCFTVVIQNADESKCRPIFSVRNDNITAH